MRVSVRPLSNDRKFQAKFEKSVTSVGLSEDLECQFCKTLITNVRNILVANTSEAEFIQVLSGLCKQSGSYAREVCLIRILDYSFVHQPYLT